MYVEDVAEAFACVLHKGVVGEVYNIGTQKERTVLDVAQDIAKVFKLPSEKIVHVRDRAFNDRYARLQIMNTLDSSHCRLVCLCAILSCHSRTAHARKCICVQIILSCILLPL